MADTPGASFDTLKKNVVDSIQSYFPFEGRKQRVVLDNVRVDDNLSTDDIHSQMDAKDREATWGVPVKADIKLVNKVTGKVVDEKKNAVLARIPKLTNRYGFIVNGNEYQVDHLFRLKSGAYARVQENGDLETEFNLKKSPIGRGFSIKFDNKNKKFSLKIGDAHIPLYPVLKSVGISDDQLEHEWGRQIFDTNRVRTEEKNHEALSKFWKKTNEDEEAPQDVGALAKHVNTFFDGTEIRPDTTAITLGKSFTKVNGEALARAAAKILHVAAGTEKPDDRDSLAFKEVVGVEDFIPERIRKSARGIKARLRQTVDHKETVGDVLSTDLFNRPVHDFFMKGGSVSERSEQTNPIQMLSASRKTTLIAPEAGGIKNEDSIITSMRVVNPSHLGFLDPMHTPESERTGITLHLGIATRKHGPDLETPVYNHEAGKVVYLNVPDFHQATVVLPDQVKWVDGKPVPVKSTIKVKRPGGDIEVIDSKHFGKDVKFVMPTAKGMFGFASNLIPFLPTDQGNRVSMADKQMEQAISLKHREAPLVQSKTDSKDPSHTFEKFVGHFVAQKAPVDGKVVEVKENSIIISDGKKHEVQLYNHFPLNDPKGMMHSYPTVKVGDSVKSGQIVADSNFTKDGVLAVGSNLRVGYMPYKGYNYEDGIVISESAAKKLVSDHLYKKDLEVDPATDTISKSKLQAHSITTQSSMTNADWDALDEKGIIKPGSKVRPGQVLIAAVGKNQAKDAFLSPYGKRAATLLKDKSLKWDEDHAGVVTRVVPSSNGKTVRVYVTTEEQAVVGDKLSGRHGNKGIITKILPDHEMPFTKEGDEQRHLEVLLNPSGVPTRINVGQMLETAAGKIAEKTGKPYIVNNFSGPDHDYRQQVVDDLKTHGLDDEEHVFDPSDVRKPLGKVLVGPQYLLKLKHQVEKKLTVRGGGSTNLEKKRLEYTADRQPSKGGENGGQAFGALDLYALLGHNARSNLREMSTYKSDQQDQMFWSMVQQGQPVPPPKPPFSYEKFVSLLKGLGVNVTKDGTAVRLMPMTNKEILSLAGNGKNEIKNALIIRSKDLKEEPGGLFDPIATGGKEGDKWSYIRLAEPMPNPIFVGQGNKPGPIPELLHMHREDLEQVIEGKQTIDGKTGGAAIEEALKKIDVKREIQMLRGQLSTLKGTPLDRANRKLKYLLALDQAELKPHEAYILHNVPVIPPKFRQPGQTPTGDMSLPPVNSLYKNLILLNEQIRDFGKGYSFNPEEKVPLRSKLWDSMKALQSVGDYKPQYDVDRSGNRVLKGILDTIGGGEGEQPKEGYFQDKLIRRRQNLSIRSTIVPEPALHIDEVGLPKGAAMELYKPFVVAQLTKWGIDPMPAQEEMKKGTSIAHKALEKVLEERPLILKRDPVLHKFSVMAFKPKLVEGKAIQIHPLVTGGFNADFDGDTMAGTVPLSAEAVEEARKMFPSKNLFSPTTGQIMYAPSQEALLGLHLLSKWGKDTGKTFSDMKELDKAIGSGAIHPTDIVKVKGLSKPTTYGRMLIESRLPRGFVHKEAILHDPGFVITKKSLTEQITSPLVKNHEGQFAGSIDELKDLGNEWSYNLGFSMGLKDLAPLKDRDAIIEEYSKKAHEIHGQAVSVEDRDKKLVANWTEATKRLDEAARKQLAGSDNRLATMIYSGARGKADQLRQMIAAPMLMTDSTNRIIPTPVTKSYSEGLDIGDYWLAQHGARKGTLQRAMGTSEPGAISKDVMNTTMSTLITSPDCKTKQGILMSVVPKEDDLTWKDIADRYLAAPYKLKGGKTVESGTLLTPEILSKLRNSKIDKVLVRSPLKCEHSEGICAKCFGLNESGRNHDIGTNIGVLAGQALGEPAVQMAMDAFHSGGIASSERGAKSVDRFTRLRNLIEMPKKLRDEATVAMTTGKITDIKKDPTGHNIFVNGIKHFVPARLVRDDVQVGQQVKKGDQISEGYINPRTYLNATKDIHATQNYLVKEMHEGLYDKEGVRRRNVEVVVRALTNLTRVKDPGSSDLIHGDIVPRSVVEEHNRSLPKGGKVIEHEPVLFGIKQVPGRVSNDWMSRLNYRELHSAIQQAAAMGQKSELHGSHPIPGIAFGAEFGKPPPGSPKHVY